MKVWLKLLLAALGGMLLGFLAPEENPAFLEALRLLERSAIQLGRYTVPPVLFFSLTIGFYELRKDGKLLALAGRALAIMAGCALLVILAGLAVTLAVPTGRIPLAVAEPGEAVSLELTQAALDLFPSNLFSALVSGGAYLLPLGIAAYLLSIGLSYDRNHTKPVIALLDSLSRIFYHIMSFISELLAPVLILLSAYWAIRYRAVVRMDLCQPLILQLGVICVLLGFGLLPCCLYALKPKAKANPWAAVYGSLGPALGAFFSQDLNFTLPLLLRHGKENLGIRRRANAFSAGLFAVFGRAGSAMTAAVAFIAILRSYSSLEPRFEDILAVGGRAFLLSFLLFRHPGNGACAALTVLCSWFGRGFEAGYNILKPLAFYLTATGTVLDALINAYASYALGKLSGLQRDQPIRRFI
ncbi:MAG: cation:dicarboxylase symporter family transporter [Treponema sp.]|jgi:Na+/H+-dicarboxylate symporter|nr:cation:dicarboxylase symporter family transporter [Treponema sp.]